MRVIAVIYYALVWPAIVVVWTCLWATRRSLATIALQPELVLATIAALYAPPEHAAARRRRMQAIIARQCGRATEPTS